MRVVIAFGCEFCKRAVLSAVRRFERECYFVVVVVVAVVEVEVSVADACDLLFREPFEGIVASSSQSCRPLQRAQPAGSRSPSHGLWNDAGQLAAAATVPP